METTNGRAWRTGRFRPLLAAGVAAIAAGAGLVPVASPAGAAVAENPLALTVGATWVIEPEQGVQRVAVPIQLAQTMPHDVNVMVTTSGDTATGGADYKELTKPTRVRIRAGRTVGYAKVAVYGDAIDEDKAESLRVHVRSTDDPTVAPGAAGTVAILERMAAPGAVDVQIGSAEIHEPSAGKVMAKLPITVSRPLAHDVVLTVVTLGGGEAEAGLDYKAMAKSVRLRAGRMGAMVSVPIYADQQTEDDERFSVVLTSASDGVAVGTFSRGVVRIVSSDRVSAPGPVAGRVELVGPDQPGVARLRWSAPTDGGAVAEYAVEFRRAAEAWQPAGITTELSMTHDCGLPEVTCWYRVTAVGAGGSGPPTEIGSVTTPSPVAPTVPGVPTGLGAELTGPNALGEVQLRWSPPTDGGTPTGYRVEVLSPDGAGEVVYDGPDTRATHRCGIPAIPCLYRVVAVNDAGEGGGAKVNVITQGLPGAPTGLSVSPENLAIRTITWTAPPDGGAAIGRYNIRITADVDGAGVAVPGATWITTTSTTTQKTVGCPVSTTTGGRCRVEVQAETPVGVGPWSNGAVIVLVAEPSNPKPGGGGAKPA